MLLDFGKYAGQSIEDIPDWYIHWMIAEMRSPFWRRIAKRELKRRTADTEQVQPELGNGRGFDALTQEILEAGYRALAKKYHPDFGGDVAKMQALNGTMEKIRKR